MRRRLYALVTVRRQRRTTGGRRELVASTSTRRPDDLGGDDPDPCSDDPALIRGRGRHAAATRSSRASDQAANHTETRQRSAGARSIATLGSGAAGRQGQGRMSSPGIRGWRWRSRGERPEEADEEAGGERLWRPRVSSRTALFVIRDAPGPGSSTRIVDLSDAEARALASRQPHGRARGGTAKARANSARSSPGIRSSASGSRRLAALTSRPRLRALPSPPPLPGTARIRGTLRFGPELDADHRLLRLRSAYGLPRSRTSRNAEILRWLAVSVHRASRASWAGSDAFVWAGGSRIFPGPRRAHVSPTRSRTVDWPMLRSARRVRGPRQGRWCYWAVPRAERRAESTANGRADGPGSAATRSGRTRSPADTGVDGEEGGSMTAPTRTTRRQSGWGTGLKPAPSPGSSRKPLGRSGKKPMSVAASVVKARDRRDQHDGCRFRPDDPMWPGPTEA